MQAAAVKVKNILSCLNELAPFDLAEGWDNVGLIVGDPEAPIARIMTSLDVSPSVIGQAATMGAELLVSHHPVIFRPVKRLAADEPVYELAKRGIAAIALHTNLDKAAGGVNDILATRLELNKVAALPDGLCRIGTLPKPMEPEAFASFTECALGVPAGGIQWIKGQAPIRTVGICSGAGGDYLQTILPLADAFVTGELHYHEWPMCGGKTVLAAGHFYTEVFAAQILARWLTEAFPSLMVRAANETCPYSQFHD